MKLIKANKGQTKVTKTIFISIPSSSPMVRIFQKVLRHTLLIGGADGKTSDGGGMGQNRLKII